MRYGECVICSAEFSPRNSRQITCSPGCSRKRRRIRDHQTQNARRSRHREEYLSYMRAYNAKYRETNADKLARQKTNDYILNRERYLAYYKKYRNRNPGHRKKKAAREHDLRRASSQAASRHGEPYTPAEDSVIHGWEHSRIELAYCLGRSLLSIDWRIRYLRERGLTGNKIQKEISNGG